MYGAAMTDENPKPKRRLNRDQRRALDTAEVASFVKQYGRRAQRGVEPNDRQIDEDVARRVKRADPTTLDRLLHDDED